MHRPQSEQCANLADVVDYSLLEQEKFVSYIYCICTNTYVVKIDTFLHKMDRSFFAWIHRTSFLDIVHALDIYVTNDIF